MLACIQANDPVTPVLYVLVDLRKFLFDRGGTVPTRHGEVRSCIEVDIDYIELRVAMAGWGSCSSHAGTTELYNNCTCSCGRRNGRLFNTVFCAKTNKKALQHLR